MVVLPSAGAALAGGVASFLWAFEGEEVMVKPPGLLIPGTKTSSHWPGRNWSSRGGRVSRGSLSTPGCQRRERGEGLNEPEARVLAFKADTMAP